MVYHYNPFPATSNTFQTKNSIRMPLLALYLPKSRTEAIMRALQIVTYAVVEKGMEYKGKQKVSFGRTRMQALELLQMVERHVSERSDVEQ